MMFSFVFKSAEFYLFTTISNRSAISGGKMVKSVSDRQKMMLKITY